MNLTILGGIAALSALSFCQPFQNQNKVTKPNMFYLLADDLGYGDLGCCGQQKFQTPNIDRLASMGMLFTQHYAGCAVCAPSGSTERGIREPMIAVCPGKIKAASTSDHVSAFWDVMPTFAELVGVTPPQNIQGISFLPALLGKEGQQEHDHLYWEFYEMDGR